MFEIFQKKLNSFASLKTEKGIALAFSGGIDSTALLLLTKKYTEKNKQKTYALIVNHNLRAESKSECEKAAEIANKIGAVTVILEKKYNREEIKNTQEWARDFRYGLMTKWCKDNNINHLLLGHHKNDQAETILMKLIRGSGTKGLSGMSLITERDQIKLIRPLLSFTKNNLKKIIDENNIKWIEDPTNSSNQYQRNIIRKIISSKIIDEDLLLNRLTNVAKNMQSAEEALSLETEKYFSKYVKVNNSKYHLELIKYFQLHDEFQFRILQKILKNLGGKEKMRSDKINILHNKIKESLFDNKVIKNYQLYSCTINSSNKVAVIETNS